MKRELHDFIIKKYNLTDCISLFDLLKISVDRLHVFPKKPNGGMWYHVCDNEGQIVFANITERTIAQNIVEDCKTLEILFV